MIDALRRILRKIYYFLNSWVGTVIVVLFIIFFIAQAFVIPSSSMERTFLVGDYLFVKKFSYGIPIPHIPWVEIPIMPDFKKNGHLIEGDRPKRGDVVVFRYPDNPKIYYIKRCVGVGGDIIAVVNKQLYVRPHEGDNFIKENYPKESIKKIYGMFFVKNPYRKDNTGIHNDSSVVPYGGYPQQIFNFGPVKVPKDEFFMMGDNRDHSNDSRFWGSVEYKYIVGQPWFIYFSWNKNYEPRWDRIAKGLKAIEKLGK